MKVTVHNDKPSQPQRAKTKSKHSEFVVVPHHDPKSGYKGKFVAKTPASAKKAQQYLAKQGINP